MTMSIVPKCIGVVVLSGVVAAQAPPQPPPLDRVLPPLAEAIYQALAPRVDAGATWLRPAATSMLIQIRPSRPL